MKRDENQSNEKRTQKDYSYQFKLQVVDEYEKGYLSLSALSRKYGIEGNTTVSKWIEKYGTLDRNYKQTGMKKSPEQELMALRQEVALLKKQKKLLEHQAARELNSKINQPHIIGDINKTSCIFKIRPTLISMSDNH